MKFSTVTIAREFGSGGGELAATIARQLGWRLLNDTLLNEVSRQAKVPLATVSKFDEHIDPWLYRVVRPIFGSGGDGISHVQPVDIFDADQMAELTRAVIENAHREGNCVVVGRGAQCALHGRPDVFHVFAYAQWPDRLRRIHTRYPDESDPVNLIRQIDEQRMEYVRRYYHQNRLDPHLYNLMLDTACGIEAAARIVISAL